MATLTAVNIREVERRRDAIVAHALSQYLTQPVDVDRLTHLLLEVLPSGLSYDQIFESVRPLAGSPLAEVDALRLAWRLAGNIRTLKAGLPVVPWTVQQADEWVPLQILRLQKTRNSKDKLGYEVTTRVLAGSPAPMKLMSFWSLRILKFIAFKTGFSWRTYKFAHGVELVGLRFYGLIEAARSRGKPEFHEIECPASMKAWNREMVLKLRFRVGLKCPAGFNHACYQCAYGYDRCPAGTHARTYEVGPCAGCGVPNAPFDPDDLYPQCVHCAAIARLRKKN